MIKQLLEMINKLNPFNKTRDVIYRVITLDISGCSQYVLDGVATKVLERKSSIPTHTGMFYKHLQVLITTEQFRQHLHCKMFKSKYGIYVAVLDTNQIKRGWVCDSINHITELDGKYKVAVSVVWDSQHVTEDELINSLAQELQSALDTLCLLIEKE